MKIKPKVGEVLIARFTYRHRSVVVTKLIVTKVGRLYFSCCREDSRHSSYEFTLASWRQKDGNRNVNNPIELFQTEQDIQDAIDHTKISRLLADNFRYQSDWTKLPLGTLKSIAGLAGLEVRL